MQLEGGLEDNILTLLAWNIESAGTIALKVTVDMFSTRTYQEIARTALNYLNKHGRIAGPHMTDELEEKLRKGDEGILLGKILHQMQELAGSIQPAYVLDQLDRFIALRRMAERIELASDAIAIGDVEAAQSALLSGFEAPVSSPGIWLHDPKAMLRFMDRHEEDVFSSGVQVLDDAGVVPKRKGLFLGIAPSGRGKSWWLIAMGRAAVLSGKTVLHLTLEMSDEEAAERYVMALFAMKSKEVKDLRVPRFKRDQYNQFASIEFEHLEALLIGDATRGMLAKRISQFKRRARLQIKAFPTGSLTVDVFRLYLDSLARTENFVPDMILVDYPDLMKTSSQDYRLSLGRVFVDLRGVGSERNAAVVAVTQGGRASMDARVVKATHVAEDFSKIATSDVAVTYSRTASEQRVNLARLLVAKARGVRDGFTVLISQSYDTGQFCMDSIRMSEDVQEEVDLHTGDYNANKPESD